MSSPPPDDFFELGPEHENPDQPGEFFELLPEHETPAADIPPTAPPGQESQWEGSFQLTKSDGEVQEQIIRVPRLPGESQEQGFAKLQDAMGQITDIINERGGATGGTAILVMAEEV